MTDLKLPAHSHRRDIEFRLGPVIQLSTFGLALHFPDTVGSLPNPLIDSSFDLGARCRHYLRIRIVAVVDSR